MDWGFLSVNLDYCNALCVEKPLTLQLFFKKDFEFPFSVVLLHINQSMMSFFFVNFVPQSNHKTPAGRDRKL